MKVVRDLVADPISGAPRDITICSTIHSPTPYCFSLFDRMLLLLRGQVVYFGQHGACLLREVPFPSGRAPLHAFCPIQNHRQGCPRLRPLDGLCRDWPVQTQHRPRQHLLRLPCFLF